MSVLSVRLPKDLEEQLPKKNRSAWVIQALRDEVRRKRIREIAQSVAANSERNLEILAEWESASAPLPDGDDA